MSADDVLLCANVRQAVHPDQVSCVEDHLTADVLRHMKWKGKDIRLEHGEGFEKWDKHKGTVGKVTSQYFVPENETLYAFADINGRSLVADYTRIEVQKGGYRQTSLQQGVRGEVNLDKPKRPVVNVYHSPIEISLVDKGRMERDYGQKTSVFATITRGELRKAVKDPQIQHALQVLYKTHRLNKRVAASVLMSKRQVAGDTLTMAESAAPAAEAVKMELTEKAVENIMDKDKRSVVEVGGAVESDAKRARTADVPGVPDVEEIKKVMFAAAEANERLEEQSKEMKEKHATMAKEMEAQQKELVALRARDAERAKDAEEATKLMHRRVVSQLEAMSKQIGPEDVERLRQIQANILSEHPDHLQNYAGLAEINVKAGVLGEKRGRDGVTAYLSNEWKLKVRDAPPATLHAQLRETAHSLTGNVPVSRHATSAVQPPRPTEPTTVDGYVADVFERVKEGRVRF